MALPKARAGLHTASQTIAANLHRLISHESPLGKYGLAFPLRNIRTIAEEYNKNIGSIQNETDQTIYASGQTAAANGGFSLLPDFTLIAGCFQMIKQMGAVG